MTNTDQREIAGTVFRHSPKRDEVNEALKQEYARREAAVKNLYRLRALRLARDGKTKVVFIVSNAPTPTGRISAKNA
jgi:hypothetical protein